MTLSAIFQRYADYFGDAPAFCEDLSDSPAFRGDSGDSPAVRGNSGDAPTFRETFSDSPAIFGCSSNAPVFRRDFRDSPAIRGCFSEPPASRGDFSNSTAIRGDYSGANQRSVHFGRTFDLSRVQTKFVSTFPLPECKSISTLFEYVPNILVQRVFPDKIVKLGRFHFPNKRPCRLP